MVKNTYPAYIATQAFNNAIFAYDNTTGLKPLPGATPANCPAGHILRVNKRQLYPGTHTNIKTIMTGVYDKSTQLSGFIDVNSAIFSLYSLNLYENDEGLDFNPHGVPQAGVVHRGQSVYTLGDVVAGGQTYPMNVINLDGSTSSILNYDFSINSYYTIDITKDTLLNATIVPKNKGTLIYIEVKGDGVSALSFGQNFDGVTTKIIPDISVNFKIIVSFISDGIHLTSFSRSSTCTPTYRALYF
jgi:hypothetical protein